MAPGAQKVPPGRPFRAKKESKMAPKGPLWEPFGDKSAPKSAKSDPQRGSGRETNIK